MKREDVEIPAISRVSRSKEDARANYDRISRWYDALAGSERHFTEAGVDRLAPAAGEKILEIGYGTGRALVRLARAVGPSGRVFGIDISEGMRAVAFQRLEREGLSKRVQLTTGDAVVLPFGSASLDAIFICFTLELFDTPEIPAVLKECHRVLSADGRMCVVSMAAEAHSGPALKLYQWMHARFPTAVDCRPIRVAASLEAAGFQILTSNRQQTWGLPVEACLAGKKRGGRKPPQARQPIAVTRTRRRVR